MKNFRKMKRPIAVAALSLTLFQFSAQQAVAVGNYQQAQSYQADRDQLSDAIGWAAFAAGVAVAAAAVAAVESAYNVGTIVGHAAYDLFGRQANAVAMDFERAQYAAADFSEFDTPTHN